MTFFKFDAKNKNKRKEKKMNLKNVYPNGKFSRYCSNDAFHLKSITQKTHLLLLLVKNRVSGLDPTQARAWARRVMSKILEPGLGSKTRRPRVLISKIISNFKRHFILQIVGSKAVERIQNFEFIFYLLNQTIEKNQDRTWSRP
jgi:hypothetical protein